ncbi:MAG TPA: fumarylacetoacetate hydrolase family protein [Alphaproteobacteria bacterium]|nr:fumarylacetoacetate hydrolase family protein [Alphaproteobacteria bacterium]
MNAQRAETLAWHPAEIGNVYGVILNDEETLARYGAALRAEPYKAEPVAPVLYFKPANTIARSGDEIELPAGAEIVEVYGTLGAVIARTACRVSEQNALSYVRGLIVAADLTLPHDSLYRPPIREKCFDGACPVGDRIAGLDSIGKLNALEVSISVNGMVMQRWPVSSLRRGIAKLIADVTAFMTLDTGDVLLLATVAGAPRARKGDLIAVEAPGIGRIENRIGRAIP